MPRLINDMGAEPVRSPDPRQRTKIVREFERRAFTAAYAVPVVWWSRIIVNAASVKGWAITPGHYLNQELADVWLDAPSSKACADAERC